MGYLYISDYKAAIQAGYFNQLVQGDDSKRLQAELYALSKCKGNLQQKYDVSQEFTETLPYDFTAKYFARSRVIIDYAAYDATLTYDLGTCVIYNNYGYICNTQITVPEPFDIAKWDNLGERYTIYYGKYPDACTYQPDLAHPNNPVFNLLKPYQVGDIVFWKNYTYQCMTKTTNITAFQMIQYYKISNIPYINVFPDDNVNNHNMQFWGDATEYSIPVGILPTDTEFWVKGDNREQQLVDAMIWITIDKLAALITPKNAVTNWEDKKESACTALNAMADGLITVDIPLIQPPAGKRIRYGGYVKNINAY